jgi:aspartyl-tRNA(Asn)/glutamyl-tRNA(Gln) amidotransferase subunit A
MSYDPATLTLAGAARLIKSGEVSPVALTSAYLDRIARYDGGICSFIEVQSECALREARNAEQEICAGRYRGPLHGIPIALKDIVETAGVRTTAHSKVLADYIPTADAQVVAKLKAAGAVLLGKLSCLEFAHARPSPDQGWPQARNPWNCHHGFTGGSSTGSASAVAASFALATLGTDTGGSVRNPAALCGIAGLMPTYGRVSRRGVIPYSFSLDHVGPLAWTVEDCALMLGAIAGHDPEDPGSANELVPDFTAQLGAGVKGRRIGWLRHFYEEDMSADDDTRNAIAETADVLRSLGAVVEETRARPLLDYHDCKVIIGAAEFWTVHEREFGAQFDKYGADLQRKTLQGALLSASDYIQAQRYRRKLAAEMLGTIAPYDALLTAINFRPAPRIETKPRPNNDFFTQPNITGVFNVTGLPAISICNGFSPSGLPLACQIAGKPFEEATLLGIAHRVEQATPWHKQRPKLIET